MINLSHLRIVLQILYHLQCILNVTLYTEAQCLQALKKNPGIEWRDGCTGITKDDRTDRVTKAAAPATSANTAP